jgi:uncharacterized protein
MKEIRITELRYAEPAGNGDLILEGRPIIYDQPATINDNCGQYTEIIRAGALDNADLSDVRLLYNHDLGKVPLARTPKTMQFRLDPAGLKLTATLPATTDGQSVYTAVKRGDLSGMSFAFKVAKDGSNYDQATNTRTITKIDKVYECSVVPFPAYPQTSVEARSVIESAQQRVEKETAARIKINQILKRSV